MILQKGENMNQLEKFVFEVDLENSLSNFFKKHKTISFDKVSAITNRPIHYSGAQLMSLFAVDAEIETKEILCSKFGNRVELIGGKEAADILINGTSYAFNVKTLYESSSTLKLCSVNTPNKIKGYDYRFITFSYRLNDLQNEIIVENVYVFNFDDIKDVVTASNNNYYITLNNVIEYTKRRDDYVHGRVSRFRRLNDNSIYDKPSVTEEEVIAYLDKRLSITPLETIKKRFGKKHNIDSLNYVLKQLVNDLKIQQTKDGQYHSNELELNSKGEIKTLNKKDIAREQYDLFRKKEIDNIFTLKQFRQYLQNEFGFSPKLASSYTLEVQKELQHAN